MAAARLRLVLVGLATFVTACGGGAGATSPGPGATAAAPTSPGGESSAPPPSAAAATDQGSGQAAKGTVAVWIDGVSIGTVKIVSCQPFTVAADGSTGVTVMASDGTDIATVVVPTIPGQIAGTIGDKDFALTSEIESTTDGVSGQFKGRDDAAGTIVTGSYTCP